jgi:hypothetical protein
MNPNPNAPLQQPNWFSRNWKWLVPVGCLVPLTCCGVFGIGTYLGVSKIIESSGAYVGAMAQVNANPEVDAALGTPVTPGLGMSGEVNEKNGVGSADFTAPIEGPKGKGSLRVVGTGKDGQWSYSTIEVTVNGKTIDVLKGARPEDAPEAPPEEEQEPQDPEPDGD